MVFCLTQGSGGIGDGLLALGLAALLGHGPVLQVTDLFVQGFPVHGRHARGVLPLELAEQLVVGLRLVFGYAVGALDGGEAKVRLRPRQIRVAGSLAGLIERIPLLLKLGGLVLLYLLRAGIKVFAGAIQFEVRVAQRSVSGVDLLVQAFV